MKLNELIPARAEFKITSRNKTYALRPMSFRDRAWIQNKFKDEPEKLLEKLDWSIILEIAYHQLEDTSKEDFLSIKKMVINDDGVKEELSLRGAEVFSDSILSVDEGMEVVKAVLQTIGISAPLFDKIMEEEIKKKDNQLQNLTTEKSGISSQVSTDTP